MKKLLFLLFACVLCCALVLTACSNNGSGTSGEADGEVPEVTDETEVSKEPGLAEKIIGKWIMEDRNGEPAPTNQKAVLTFISPEEAFISASFTEMNDENWENGHEMDVAIDGDKVTLSMKADSHTTIIDELSVSDITDIEMDGSLVVKTVKDGDEKEIANLPVRFRKIDEDYSEKIIGTWEGHRTSKEGDFDDGKNHRWEYKDDATFVYYYKKDGKWTASNQKVNDYFVDGNLLCTRWDDNGKIASECWEIKINGDKMEWTAVRMDDDKKTTYTAAFEMKRVKK